MENASGTVALAVPAILVAGLRHIDRMAVIGALVEARPWGERWAVVSSGLMPPPMPDDAALVTVHVIPGGCACCAGATPFRVGLTRLLRRMADAPPVRLVIEGGDDGHAVSLRTRLAGPAFGALLRLTCVVAAVDCAHAQIRTALARAALADLAQAADLVILVPAPQAGSPALAAMTELVLAAAPHVRTIHRLPTPEDARAILAHGENRQ